MASDMGVIHNPTTSGAAFDDDDDEPQNQLPDNLIDVDPFDWLNNSANEPVRVEDVAIPYSNVRIKLGALTDDEENSVRQRSKRPVTGAKSGQTSRFNVNAYKRNFIAFSMNKALGRSQTAPNAVLPDQLSQRPTGELTFLLTEAMRISGMDTETKANAPDPSAFFD